MILLLSVDDLAFNPSGRHVIKSGKLLWVFDVMTLDLSTKEIRLLQE